jgi:flagellar motor switch protein FliN/FliY
MPDLTDPADPQVKPAEFPDLSGAGNVPPGKHAIDLVRDIQVVLTVELGRTDMLIQDILELTPGKVIELDRLAGEPLDIMVNGKLLAKGEVVVVDENFGVRITSILDPSQREQALGTEGAGRK